MRDGGFLYIEEFNRAPEDTLNTLLTAMAERQIAVPTGRDRDGAPTFRVIASMNPYDNVGTTRLSTSVHDRLCRLAIGYQDATAERGIVACGHRRSEPAAAGRRRGGGHPGHPGAPGRPAGQQRARRHRPRPGRGAAGRMRGGAAEAAGDYARAAGSTRRDESVALSGRIFLDETVEATPEAVLRQIWEDQFILAPAAAAPG